MFGNNQEHCLKRVTTKFEIFDKVYVIRSQSPIMIAYAITIHKSQGLTLNHVLADIGSTVFTCGQAYVALSRVKSIVGLHLINFNPRSVKALDSAILEYNRLRKNSDLACKHSLYLNGKPEQSSIDSGAPSNQQVQFKNLSVNQLWTLIM